MQLVKVLARIENTCKKSCLLSFISYHNTTISLGHLGPEIIMLTSWIKEDLDFPLTEILISKLIMISSNVKPVVKKKVAYNFLLFTFSSAAVATVRILQNTVGDEELEKIIEEQKGDLSSHLESSNESTESEEKSNESKESKSKEESEEKSKESKESNEESKESKETSEESETVTTTEKSTEGPETTESKEGDEGYKTKKPPGGYTTKKPSGYTTKKPTGGYSTEKTPEGYKAEDSKDEDPREYERMEAMFNLLHGEME